MERLQTLTILNALANGIHPATGEQFGPDSPYQHPDTVRALFSALRALEGGSAQAPAASDQRRQPGAGDKPRQPTAGNGSNKLGSRWTPDEEARLAGGFDAGKRVSELASAHGRSIAAIEARLLKLGKIDASAVTASLRYGPAARSP